MRPVFIYTLCDPTGYIFYVGQTVAPKKRELAHRRTFGEYIKLEILDKFDESCATFWETHYIHLFLSWGFDLKNVALRDGYIRTFKTKELEREVYNRYVKELTKYKRESKRLKKINENFVAGQPSNVELFKEIDHLKHLNKTLESKINKIRHFAKSLPNTGGSMTLSDYERELVNTIKRGFVEKVFAEIKQVTNNDPLARIVRERLLRFNPNEILITYSTNQVFMYADSQYDKYKYVK